MLDRFVTSLGRLVGRSAPEGEACAEAERRLWVRYPCNLETVSQIHNGTISAPLSGRVRDISRGGLSLVMDREVSSGGLLSVELPGVDDEPSSTVLAYVVHATQRPDGQYLVGCTFATELTDEDLQPFGAKRQRPTTPDKRHWVRFPCETQATYEIIRGADPTPGTARVLNLSTNGVGLAIGRPVEVGMLLNLALQSAAGTGQLSMLASVVRVSHRQDEWLLGCNFIRELSDAELDALVSQAPENANV